MSTKNKSSADADAPEQPVHCDTANCPFWGVPSRQNLCSQCYKEKIKEEATQRSSRSLSMSVTKEIKKEEVVAEVETKPTEAEIENLPPPTPVAKSPPVGSTVPAQAISGLKDESVEDTKEVETAPVKRVQKDKRRCLECNRFVGFRGIKCNCGYVFCGQHRFPDRHECDFDFEERARNKLQQHKTEAAVAEKIAGERL